MSTSVTASPGPSRSKPTKKATVDELREGLEQLGLDSKGKKETLFRRWVNFLSRSLYIDNAATEPNESSNESSSVREESPVVISPKKWGKQPIRSFLCFDVEATCRGGREFDWPNEVIEFPVILCRWKEGWDGELVEGSEGSRLEQLDTFHTYVRPTWKPILTEFCTSLTGITQETVDKSPTFSEMLVDLEKWMNKWDLLDERGALKDAVWVSDGPWDLRDFVAKQLHITPPLPPSPAYPAYFLGPYLNIKQATQTYLCEKWKREQYVLKHPNDPPNLRAQSRITTSKIVSKHDRENANIPNFWFTLTGQVEQMGLGEFKGKQHSGIDDATNVARVLTALGDQDVLIEANARITQKKKWPWMGKPGEVKWEEWMSILQPIKPVVVEEKLDEKVPILAPVVEIKGQEPATVSTADSDRAPTSDEAKTVPSATPSEVSEISKPSLGKEDAAGAKETADLEHA